MLSFFFKFIVAEILADSGCFRAAPTGQRFYVNLFPRVALRFTLGYFRLLPSGGIASMESIDAENCAIIRRSDSCD
jgi:hypothetical protein